MAEIQLADINQQLTVHTVVADIPPESLDVVGLDAADPWQNAILYTVEGRGWRLVSLGSDGAAGGSGTAEDLVVKGP